MNNSGKIRSRRVTVGANQQNGRKSILRSASSTRRTNNRVRFFNVNDSPDNGQTSSRHASPPPNVSQNVSTVEQASPPSPTTNSSSNSTQESPIDLTVNKTANPKCYGPAIKNTPQSTPSRQLPGLIPINLNRRVLGAIDNSTPRSTPNLGAIGNSTPNRLAKGTTVALILNRVKKTL